MLSAEKIWVIAPIIDSEDEHLKYYYDYKQSIAEYEKVFSILNKTWAWQQVTISNCTEIIDAILLEAEQQKYEAIFLNLCDGDEVNGAPGISALRHLQNKKAVFTGASDFFYNITTSKISMKLAFDAAGVTTPPWEAIRENTNITQSLFNKLGCPIILKPAVSGGSMGVGVNSVVYDVPSAQAQITSLYQGYRGWDLTVDDIIAETFIRGDEFTVFIIGSYDQPNDAKIFTPVQRVFHASLPEDEKFLSFDRLWEIYEAESAMPNQDNFYEYAPAPPMLVNSLKEASWQAFAACKGTGYTRVDLRFNNETKQINVLEVNAQCGISEDADFTSIGAILRFDNISFAQTIDWIIEEAKNRQHKN